MDNFKNFSYGTILTAPSPATSGTSLVLNSGQGALMPTVPFNGVVWPTGAQPLSSNAEIVRVTDITTDTLTIVRTQEGSSARTIVVGDQFGAMITAKEFSEIEQRVENVTDYMTDAEFADGQTGTPVLDVAGAFEAAVVGAKKILANNFLAATYTTIELADWAVIKIPSGKWTLGSLVDTGGVNVIWEYESGAFITDYQFLNGTIHRPGDRIARNSNGMFDNAVAFSALLNQPLQEDSPIVFGFSQLEGATVNQPAGYASRDAVGFYSHSYAPPIMISIPAATYDATHIYPTTPLNTEQIKLLRKGMLIDTLHSPTKYTGFILSWLSNGTSITTSGWVLSPGSGTAATPSNSGSPGAYVNPVTKIWGMNANVFLLSDSLANEASAFEFGVINNKAQPASDGASPAINGMDMVNLGTYTCQSAFLVRNSGGASLGWYRGIDIYENAADIGLTFTTTTQQTGYAYFGTGNAFLALNSPASAYISMGVQCGSSATMQLGAQGGAGSNTPKVEFFSSGHATKDSDIIASGGTGAGDGVLKSNAGVLTSEWFIRQASSRALTNTTSEQKLFNSVSNGTLTMPTGTYFFECMASISGLSATSGNGAFDILGAGSATLGDVLYTAVGMDNSAGTAATITGSVMVQGQSPASMQTAGTNTAWQFSLSGTFEVTGAGTIIPSVTLVTAAAGTVASGSFFKCHRVGDVNVVSSGPWT